MIMAKIPVIQEDAVDYAVQSPIVWEIAEVTPASGNAVVTGETTVHGDSGSDDAHTGTLADGDAAAHSAVFPPFDSSTFASQLLWLAITFAALYFLMSRVALPRIGDILEARRDNIEGKLAEAERMRQKTDQALQDYETALADAKSKALSIAEDTRTKVKSDLDGKRTKVEADLTQKIVEAEARIQATKKEALGNVGEIATETAQALVAKIASKVPVKAARDAVAKVSKEHA